MLTQTEKQEVTELKERIKQAFEAASGVYGYRRLLAELNSTSDQKISEWKLRKYMKKLGLYGRRPKRKRYNSYDGESSKAPINTCVDIDGKHHFKTYKPNMLWITDITEFAIPAGKVYLSPIIDCFDGMPISWSIGTSPNAELANSALRRAYLLRGRDDETRIHSDRGGHYRWNEWIKICRDNGLVRSMSRLGYSPDNARCEGFFGRLKIEFFFDRDWEGVSIEDFMVLLNDYMV